MIFIAPNPVPLFKLSMARICFIPIASVTHLCRLHNLERKVKPFPEGRQHNGHTRKLPETVPITEASLALAALMMRAHGDAGQHFLQHTGN